MPRPAVSTALAHFYSKARDWQRQTYGNSGLRVPNASGDGFRDAREFVGGGAAYGFHALAALNSARRQIAFRADLKSQVATAEKRSKSAKRGWAKRRQQVPA